MVVFLCSDLARFVTGQNIVVDGGMTLHGSGVDGLYRYFKPGGPITGHLRTLSRPRVNLLVGPPLTRETRV